MKKAEQRSGAGDEWVERGANRFRPIAFGGRCYYVRKCATGQVDAADSAYRTLRGVTLPDIAWDKSHWVEILGRGRKADPEVRVGDLALLKIDCFSEVGTTGVKRSPFDIHEAFIEDTNLVALWRDEDGGSQHDQHS